MRDRGDRAAKAARLTALTVLRLLAVYFATAAAVILAARRWVGAIPLRAALFLALAPFLFVGRAMLTAGVYAPIDITYVHQPFLALAEEKGTSIVRSPILSDVAFSMLPWRKAVREAVKHGRLPLWNRFQLAGEPLLAAQQHGAFHPETIPLLLLPLAQGWTLLMALRFFVSLLSAYLFLRDVTGRELPAMFGAAAWGFCDFLVFFEGYPLSPAVGPLPLLLLGVRRLAREPGRRAVGITVVALLLTVTAGHPESLLHVVAAGGVYFLFELAWTGRRTARRAFLLSLLAGALALGLSAIVLLPLAEALPLTSEHASRSGVYAHQKRSVDLPLSIRRTIRDFVPYAYGVLGGYAQVMPGFAEPGAYAGSLLLPLAWIGLRSGRRERWAFLTLGLLGLCVSVGLIWIADAVARLPFFRIAVNERLAFLFAFSMAALAALGVERLSESKARRELAIAAIVCAAVLAAMFARVLPGAVSLGLTRVELARRLAIQLAPLVLLLLLALGARASWGVSAAAALLAILLVERRLESGSLYPTYPDTAFAPHLPVLDPIPRGQPWRFAGVGYELVPNVSCLYELEDVRSYAALTLASMVQTFSLWCVPQPIWFNRIDDPTRPFLSFLNVRYVLLPPETKAPAGWPVLAETPGGTLAENPGALPRAFVPDTVALIEDPIAQLDALARITDFRRVAVVQRAGGGADVAAGVPNGRATARISSYGAQEMTLDLDAREPAVVATSIPRWPGWNVSLDGRPWPSLVVNRAFVGFRAPSGRHTARLFYLPDSVRLGGAASVLTLVACVGMLSLPRRTRRRRGGPPPAA